MPDPATALFRCDFDQKYYVHPGRQTWDFCLVRSDSLFHLFYHSIPDADPGAAHADTIWHAVSPDLRHWTLSGPVLTAGPDWWDAGAIWAPDVIWDPDRDSWAMLYTGVDSSLNQRACLAFSPDLRVWSKSAANPVFEPDSTLYDWNPTGDWSDFRDPFVFRADGRWQMLSTAALRRPGTTSVGIIHRASSPDLIDWTDEGAFFVNDGTTRWHVLESTQYHVRDGIHHLYFGEYDTYGISHLAVADTSEWTMADCTTIDWGNAPEVKEFDPDLFGRIAAYQHPVTETLSYCIRFDTLTYSPDGYLLEPYQPHPLDETFESWNGFACLGQPTFGDNSAERGEVPAGPVGNGYFGSAEFYQGPLSGRGSPGGRIGDSATGTARSYPFIVAGWSMELLVGGGDYPETCYVALFDAATDTVLCRATGKGVETMSLRSWDLRPYIGRLCYIAIVDAEIGPMGHINVDEIVELADPPSSADGGAPAHRLVDRGPSPNPFNPATDFRFALAVPATVEIRVHDLRGRLLWSSRPQPRAAGVHTQRWDGRDRSDRPLPAGVYLYTLRCDSHLEGSGKLTIVR
jgi:hypothetical protein